MLNMNQWKVWMGQYMGWLLVQIDWVVQYQFLEQRKILSVYLYSIDSVMIKLNAFCSTTGVVNKCCRNARSQPDNVFGKNVLVAWKKRPFSKVLTKPKNELEKVTFSLWKWGKKLWYSRPELRSTCFHPHKDKCAFPYKNSARVRLKLCVGSVINQRLKGHFRKTDHYPSVKTIIEHEVILKHCQQPSLSIAPS